MKRHILGAVFSSGVAGACKRPHNHGSEVLQVTFHFLDAVICVSSVLFLFLAASVLFLDAARHKNKTEEMQMTALRK